uniref:BAR/IMD domain containing adaptor protein 2 n=1 Tax=Equus asinus asinus TaxID=83772 RepID=A0A8C4PIB5_EQUAS
LGSLAQQRTESQSHSELRQRDVLFQMAEVHRQIQNQLEEMLKSFHNELLTQLEQKVELDSRYLSFHQILRAPVLDLRLSQPADGKREWKGSVGVYHTNSYEAHLTAAGMGKQGSAGFPRPRFLFFFF